MKLLREFRDFLCAREAIRVAKEAGKPAPWTTDPILASYRFCNINREHDKVTKFIRGYYSTMPQRDLWFHLIVARLFNNPVTLQGIGRLNKHHWQAQIRHVARELNNTGERVFNAAYIVSTNGRKMDKVQYLLQHVLDQPALDWTHGSPLPLPSTCAGWAEYLLEFNGLGDFMVNQIVTDMKYTALLPRQTTKDWTTFVMAGPGTKRGLNRLYGNPTKQALSRTAAYNGLIAVRFELEDHPLRHYFDDLNNLSNSFCEFDKWCRVAAGEGKPKQLYRGGAA